MEATVANDYFETRVLARCQIYYSSPNTAGKAYHYIACKLEIPLHIATYMNKFRAYFQICVPVWSFEYRM